MILGATALWVVLRRVASMNSSSDPEWSGWEAAWLGDLDGDRVPEIALLTWCEPVDPATRDRSVLRVLSGASGATIATFRDLGTQGPAEQRIGPAGDLDGDGREEVWWM